MVDGASGDVRQGVRKHSIPWYGRHNTPVGSGQYPGIDASFDTGVLRRRYALVAPLIRPCCAVDTPLLIARFLPLCDTLVRNSNRLCGKKTYSHFRVCFRLFIAIERFAMVSHSFPIRFTFGSHLRSSCCRPTLAIASGDVRRSLARHAALYRVMQVVASPDTRRCLGLTPDPLGLFGRPT